MSTSDAADASRLSWDVLLPKRGEGGLGRRRPRAQLLITSDSHGEERLLIPVSVGRRLNNARDDITVGSRAELLYTLGELSRACASKRVAALVERRDYSQKELGDRLFEDGFTPKVVDAAVARAVECGLVDDMRYASAFIRSRVARGWGRTRIERELSRRGIECADVPGWPDEYLSAEDEEETAHRLASARRLTGKNDYEKLVRFLVGRGYALSLAKRTARRVLDEAQEDEDA